MTGQFQSFKQAVFIGKFYLTVILCSMRMLSIAGCDRTATIHQKNRTAVPVESNQSNKFSVLPVVKKSPKINSEYIQWDDITINGKLPLLTTTRELFSLLGKPDSLVRQDLNEVCTSFYDDKPFKNAYFQDSEFEIYGDTAVVSYINFKSNPNIFLKTSLVILSSKTTLAEIKKLFPKSAESLSELNVQNVGRTMAINIPNSKQASEGFWLLLFQNGKLLRIDDYFPC